MLKNDLINYLEEIAPSYLAESWDNCGLIVDCGHQEYNRVCLALDATEDSIAQAANYGAQLMITHHPILFEPIRRINDKSRDGKAIMSLIKNDISLLAMHTNLDSARIGINQALASMLELKNISSLEPRKIPLKKVVVYVPRGSEEEVFEAMINAGAGHIGNYSHCSFRSKGTGTFLAMDGADPYIGDVGELAKADEVKLETVVKSCDLDKVVREMLIAHPYEEAAFDIFDLDCSDNNTGLGVIGEIEAPAMLRDYAAIVKEKLGCPDIRYVGDDNAQIKRVALSSGGGFSMFDRAAAWEADVFITGDIKHHNMLEAQSRGICVIDAGHFATENIIVEQLFRCLQQRFNNVEYNVMFKCCDSRPPYCAII